ncbi:hypothetical protein HMPREF3224_01655 [Anaerococcus hydrogenalis]|nr:hypothetical protein HMPREF3224_01655 [Anaerococcus hydrogenalis]
MAPFFCPFLILNSQFFSNYFFYFQKFILKKSIFKDELLKF